MIETPLRRLLCLCLLLIALPVMAEPGVVARAASPGGVLEVIVEIDDGRVTYRVERLGRPVLAASRLGFLLRDAERIERNLQIVEVAHTQNDSTWEQPWGERRFVRDRHAGLTVWLVERSGSRRRFAVEFRVFDDGLGFRYRVPAQPGVREFLIEDELTEFVITDRATAWWIPAGEWNRYEYLYQRTPLTEVTQAHTPLTVRTQNGLHLSFHEAALVDYAGMWLRRITGQTLRARLSPASDGISVRRRLPFDSPWRTVVIADSAGALVESNLILNLNAPNLLGDVSWFVPSKYVGIWWSLHLEKESWATGPQHGATTANARRYIDFAAANGIRGLLIEGWNSGWDGDWFGNGWSFDFTHATPDFNLEAVAAYARDKGVHLIGHHETGCAASHYERQMDAAYALDQRLGIDQVKTGYVCDAGQVERQDVAGGPVKREWHDGQWMANHHLRVVQAAARHRVAINAHEPIKDTGLRRTYPNWISREGARGMEYNAWANPKNPPEHEVNLVFTRLLAGPMDYTPGVLSLTGRGGTPIPSTLARQLALYVTIYSPIQMLADLPENYARYPEAMRFLRDVPTDWNDTRVLAGEVGDFVAIARRDRHSEDWYLGAITDESGRVLNLDLSFLTPGRHYRAEIYRDGAGADFENNRFSFVREERPVSSSERLTVILGPGGGQAVRLVALPE